MFGLSPAHLLLLLLIVVLIFGTKKLGNIGGDVASAIKNFRKGLHDDDATQQQLKADPPIAAEPPAAGAEVKRENPPQG
jgi:sec-independent protein translocase protein TatA